MTTAIRCEDWTYIHGFLVFRDGVGIAVHVGGLLVPVLFCFSTCLADRIPQTSPLMFVIRCRMIMDVVYSLAELHPYGKSLILLHV